MALVEYDTRRALLVGGILSSILAAGFVVFDTEASPLFLDLRTASWANPVPLWVGLVASMLVGMGIGSLVALCARNQHRLRAVLRPTKGRIISTAVLALLAPFAQFWGIPVPFGFAVIEFPARLVKYGAIDPNLAFILLLFLGVVLAAAYLVSSLIISGVRSRFVRIALFGQMWLAVYGGTLLAYGFYSGNM